MEKRDYKLLRIFTTILLLVTLTVLQTNGYAQTISSKEDVIRITIAKKNVPLATIFDDIHTQTGYGFSYEEQMIALAHNVSIDVTDASLEEVLNTCFAGQPLTYEIDGKIIYIHLLSVSKQPITVITTTVSGKVMDIDGRPLQGATIRFVGAAIMAASANKYGAWQLNAPGRYTAIEVSFVGYDPKIIKIVDGQKAIPVYLKVGLKSLNEIVTNGYRNTPRRFNLGTSSKITAEEIGRQPVNNFLAVLAAKVPGLTIIQNSGVPGAGYTLQLRGQRSVGAFPGSLPVNSPLFIIDGVPFLSSSESLAQYSKIIAHSPFSTINPEDIESIEVLRDANATSIYGSLGANGVILITTKKPRPGQTTIDVKMYTGWEKVIHILDYMNTKQYVTMRREALANDYGQVPDQFNAPDLVSWDTTGEGVNWRKLLLGGTAKLSNAHIRLSGGSVNTQFSFSVGYNKETTVFPGDFNKTMASLNLNVKHVSENEKLEVMLNTSYGNDKSKLPNQDLTNFINLPPNAPYPLDSLGHLVWGKNEFDYPNPYAFTLQDYTVSIERLTGSMQLKYKVLPFLSAKTNLGYTVVTGDELSLLPIAAQDPNIKPAPTGSAVFGKIKSKNWIIEPQLEFNKSFGPRFKLKALAGTSFREQTGSSELITASGYVDDANLKSLAAARSVKATNDYKQYRIESAYGLINGNWQEKYLLEFTARRDGSSRFGPKKQFANFGSVAAGWIFSKENLIKEKIPFLSNGKLRFSYGTTGNDQIGDYQFLDTWINTTSPYQGTQSFRPARLYNNDYRWETQESVDIGLDLGFFHDRLQLSAVWNRGRTGNQLVAYPLPTQTGFSSVLRNLPALVQNTNLEMEITSVNIKTDHFQWNTSLNISQGENKLIKFPGLSSSSYKTSFQLNQPLNLAWGYQVVGVDPVTGIYQFRDKNGNIIPVDLFTQDPDQYVNLGAYKTAYYGGLDNSISYKNWEFDLLFQFVNQTGRHSTYPLSPAGFLGANQPVYLWNRWQHPGDNAPYQQYTADGNLPAGQAAIAYAESAASFTDASYIRLKNLSLSYSLPMRWMNKIKFNSVHLFVQGENVLTITSYKGDDPENGTKYAGYLPPLKTWVVGIQASF